MSNRTLLGRRLLLWSGVLVLPLVAGRPAYAAPAPGAFAVPLGIGAGIALYLALARGTVPCGIERRRVPAVVARSAYLLARAAVEEVIWRVYIFAALVPLLGAAPAFALSVTLFALAHRPAHGRLWIVHLGTGAMFTGVFAVSGSAVAAIAAHAAYNVSVGLAVEGVRKPAVAIPATIAALEGVVKRFGAVTALAGVELGLSDGEVVALLGPNGAGKTTAVKILLGLRRPDAGRAVLFGRNPRDPPARLRVGAMPQEVGFPWPLRVREIVHFVAAHFPTAATEALLDRFSLHDIANRQAGALSGGQKRRLAVALAFTGRPHLLVLDEPTAGLDVETRRAVWNEVSRHARDGGTVLLTTHHLEEAEALSSRVVLLARGRIVGEGAPAQIAASVGLSRVRLRAAALPALPLTVAIERAGDRYTVYTSDADAVVSELVAQGVAFAELEVLPARLEDAFLHLTRSDG